MQKSKMSGVFERNLDGPRVMLKRELSARVDLALHIVVPLLFMRTYTQR